MLHSVSRTLSKTVLYFIAFVIFPVLLVFSVRADESTGVTTELTVAGGEIVTVAGLPDSEAAAEAESYRVLFNGTELCTVDCHTLPCDELLSENSEEGGETMGTAVNGYYSITFMCGSTEQAFITGLTQDNIEMIQTELIKSALSYKYLDITDIGFIDTEKQNSYTNTRTEASDSDLYLCWAAACSNLLHYTGWGAKAGFGSADYIYDLFADCFTNDGGTSDYGVEWFFNGVYQAQSYKSSSGSGDWSVIDATGDMAYGTFTGFLPEYDPWQLIDVYTMEDPQQMFTVFELLRSGYGVNLNYGYYSGTERESGHAITLWGYVLDTSACGKDSLYAVIVSDSDSDITQGDNRRTAPNALSYRMVSPICIDGTDSWSFDCFSVTTVIDEIITLAPVQTATADTEGTHSPLTDEDLTVKSVELYTSRNGQTLNTEYFAAGETLYIYPEFYNRGGDTTSENAIYYSVEVLRGESTVKTVTGSFTCRGGLPAGYYTNEDEIPNPITLTGLSAGVYTVRVCIDTKNTEIEAYECNNTCEVSFSVGTVSYSTSALPTFTISADYSKGNDDAVLNLTYGRTCAFEAEQYVLELSYYDGYGYGDYTAVWWGDELPTSVPLEPQDKAVRAQLTIIPKAGTGFKGSVRSGNSAQLLYHLIEIERVSGSSLTSISSDAESLNGNERFKFKLVNKSTIEGSDYKAHVTVYGYYDDAGEDENPWVLLASDGSEILNHNSDTISLELFEGLEKDEKPESLSAGTYSLYANVYYEPVQNNMYTNNAFKYFGELTVEGTENPEEPDDPEDPEDPEEPDDQEPEYIALHAFSEISKDLTYGEEIYFETDSITFGTAGVLTCSGADGTICIWDETESAWGEPVYFTLSGTEQQVTITSGKPLRIKLMAYMAGTYKINCDYSALSDSAYTLIQQDDTQGYTVAACFNEGGKLLDTRVLNGGGTIMLEIPESAVSLKLYRFSEAGIPIGEVSAIALE